MSSPKHRRTLGDVRIKLDGKLLTNTEISGLLSIRVQQHLSTPAQAELVFHMHQGFSVEEFAVAPTNTLQINLAGEERPLFLGQVNAIDRACLPDGGQALHFRAYDVLYPLFHRQQVRTHVQTNVLALAQEWAADLDFNVENHVDPPPSDWNWQLQFRQTDGAWLMAVAHEQGYYFHAQDRTLTLLTLQGSNEPAATLKYRDNLREGRQSTNARYQCEGVEVLGWDPVKAKVVQGKSGKQKNTHQTRLVHSHTVSTQSQAKRTATAINERCQAGEKQFWGVAEGDAGLYPGRKIALEDFPHANDNAYVLTRVTHKIDANSGYTSELDTQPPEPAVPSESPTPAAMPGIVSNVNDPKDAGRVKVNLITCGDVETDWLPVMQQAAGKNKGLLSLPSCGDQVIFLLMANDPAQAVVLAGLYGSVSLPDKAVKGDKINRYAFHTPDGHYLRFDESEGKVTLNHKNGSHLSFSRKKTRLHSTTDFILEAPKQKIVIRGKKIDFEKG